MPKIEPQNEVWVIYSVYTSRGDENEHMIGVYDSSNQQKVLDIAWNEFKELTKCGDKDREDMENYDDMISGEVIGYGTDEIFVYCKPAPFHKI